MRIVIAAVAAFSVTASAAAQEAAFPAGLAELEMDRSRTCVDVLFRLSRLDEELEPLAQRAQHLVAIAEAVALEDERVMDELDQEDPIEAQVHAWFVTDRELAQRYVATLAAELNEQRAAGRDEIGRAIAESLAAIQAEADQAIAASGDLPAKADPCNGAIFVRSAVVEACATASGPLCDEAALAPSDATRFRFVDSPEAVWDITEVRPWTDPTPLVITPEGQLEGARTIGYARTGNVVVSVSFSPMLRERSELTPEELQDFQTTNDSLGLVFDHPDLAFAPGVGLRATLPMPIADESTYVLHFGPPENADVLWTTASGSGTTIESTVRIGASHVERLKAGEPLTFTALRDAGPADDEAAFTIELAVVNQTRAIQALVGYMASELGVDLAALLRRRGSQ